MFSSRLQPQVKSLVETGVPIDDPQALRRLECYLGNLLLISRRGPLERWRLRPGFLPV